jgi:type IV pilus assembly protein PilA
LSGGGDAVDSRERRVIRSRGGFTLIELMIVVAIIGVLAAIAIPAYRDYVYRAKMSEVLTVFDAIAQGATEYHAVMGYFPDQSYTAKNLADFSEEYATITLNNIDYNFIMGIRADFKSNLNLKTLIPGNSTDFGSLMMHVTYNTTTGYGKSWDLSTANTTIDAIYIPKGGGQ